MDIKSKCGYPSSSLSNFAPHRFVFDSIECCSMEGFLQSLKFSNIEMQKYVCTLVGIKAKNKGRFKNWKVSQELYWLGNIYDRHSIEYTDLISHAYDELYIQCESFRNALKATGNSSITHFIGKKKKSDTILTEQEFCSNLIRVRNKLEK